VNVRTVERWVKAGEFLGAFKFQPDKRNSTVLIPVKDYQEFVERMKHPAA
jgi:hypothetical protein